MRCCSPVTQSWFPRGQSAVAFSGKRCSWQHKSRHPLPAAYLLRCVTNWNYLMNRWWTGLGLGFSLLGTLALGGICYAMPQDQQAIAGADKVTDERTSSSDKAGKAERAVEPAGQWEDRENSVGLHLLKNIAEDQKAVWIGPKSLRLADADWLVPLGGAAAAMFATDSSYSRHLSNSPNRIKYSKDLSNYGIASMIGLGGGLYLWGHITHDDHKIETG